MRSTFISLLACSILGLLAVACDDGEKSTPTDVAVDGTLEDLGAPEVDVDVAPEDTVAPEFRDVRVTLVVGDISKEVDLNQRSQTRVLETGTQLEFHVFVKDDKTPVDAVFVEVVDEAGVAIDGQTPVLRNGLWNLSLPAPMGTTITIAATDLAGNRAIFPNPLVLPTHTDAIVRDWVTRFFDVNQTIEFTDTITYTADTWCEARHALPHRGGTWVLEADGRLRLSLRHELDCSTANFGTEWDSIESETLALPYVDDTYFHEQVFVRTAGGPTLVGTWARTVETFLPGANGLALAHTTITTLEFAETTWLETTQDTDHTAADAVTESTRAGTWLLAVNQNYEDWDGGFLDRQLTTVDGVVVPPERLFEVIGIRGEALLILPRVDPAK
ncbi:MAG: hypothetical protein AUK47_13240 [Deltaproteobacteria bacterium CG2_30_63_29]|nr:MAG: hypothetical protein AUK47_13240 [Deltaproteobacteria bacterium CG2_30_63_29]PIV98916.1 MAG: hypothetical protein COW42_12770 [Deltaproteobacteria bacterium CG17_big_fil_post_rev_8_21_14_2_50_63_7]